MPCKRSSGSKPVTTMGARYFAASGRYSSTPITVQTCPAARNPSTRRSGAERIDSIAGGTSTCETSSEKLVTPRDFAWCTAIAWAGAVVSKPTAKKTISRSGRCSARASASSGEYTTRTSPPRAFTDRRSRSVPGTRSMSPNEQKITSGREASATAWSTIATGVTQTGHPGPWISAISGGKSSSRPKRTIVWVCPPQISMSDQGRVTTAWIASAHRRTASASRNSSTYLTARPRRARPCSRSTRASSGPRPRRVD